MMLDHPSIESTQNLFKQANPVAQARYLAAAVLHDVCGWPLGATAGRPFSENIACHFDYGAGGPKDAVVRAARNAVYGGRVLWARLLAWPWWALGHSRPRGEPLAQWLQRRLPDDWWTVPHVVANFQAWQDPDAFLAGQAAARARQQHQRRVA